MANTGDTGETKIDVLAYVAGMLEISREKASELTGQANDAVSELVNPEHIIHERPDRDAILAREQRKVNVEEIASRLHVAAEEFRSWVEDEMIFIEFGRNLAEGVTSEGPTALSATANFYCRWYHDVILKHGSVLLSDDQHHRYNEQGEE